MVFVRAWNTAYEASPPGSQAANLLDTRIQEVKIDVRERIATEHYMDETTGTTGTADGVHMFPSENESGRDAISSPKNGQLVVRSDTRSIDIYDGSDWVEYMAWSPGDMKVAGHNAAADPGWLKCDGSAVSRTTYADLFAAIADAFGVGDGSTTFNVPDMAGQIPIGIDSGDGDFDAIAETAGTKTHTIIEANLPPHAHDGGDLTTDDPGDHNHTLDKKQGGGGQMDRISTGISTGSLDETTSTGVGLAGAHTHVIDSGTTGDGDGVSTAINHMPPVIAIQWYIKT